MVAGPIVDGLGYRWLFFLPMIAVVVAAIGAHVVSPESRVRAGGSVNLLAAALLSGWLVCLLLCRSARRRSGAGTHPS